MVHYKLTYFNGRGRAELSRLIFAAAGQEYEDIRFERAQWPEEKAKTPYGQVPLLDVDGVQLNQSLVIAGYLASEFGLAGTTKLEHAQAAALAATVEDMVTGLFEIAFSPPEVKEKKLEEYKTGKLTTFADLFEKNIKATISEEGFVVGHKLTYADLAFLDIWDRLDSVGPLATEALKTRPTLAAHRERIRAIPNIATWLAKRPESIM